jgi:hypothetical protein
MSGSVGLYLLGGGNASAGYGLDDRGVGVLISVGSRIFTSPYLPDRFWGPSSDISGAYRGLFPRG